MSKSEAQRQANARWAANNPDKMKAMNHRQYLRRKKANPNITKQWWKDAQKTKNDTCEIITKHNEDLKDDPESLSTEFIMEMTGIY